jgi:uncharacterized lipoprotein YddW (UPF0748 family)
MKKAIRICSLLLAVVVFVGLLPASLTVSAEQKTILASGMNKERGSGDLIYYDSTYGTSTKTNEWGYEVTVDSNNKVTKVGGFNSQIPEGGFVLSGHNTDGEVKRGKELETSIKVGDYVYFNKNSMLITISDQPVKPSMFYTTTHTVNGTNITRSTDFLVIYNNRGAKTGTNEWGYEVIVENNIVTKMGGNDNQIPNSENSYIVSGHGKSCEWLKNNIKLGMSVTYDSASKTITFEYDAKSAIFNLEAKLESIETELASAKENYRYIDYKTIEEKLDATKSKFENAVSNYNKTKNTDEIDALSLEIEDELTAISKLLAESRTVEYRGVWLRPIQTTAKAVDDYVQKLYDAGINLICIETLYDCTMIMPMPKDSLFSQNPKWRGFDMLEAFIESCHKRGMELHLWMPIYYVGHKNSSNAALSVATKKPEWMSVNNSGGNYSPEDDMYYQMLSPANKEVKEFLLKTYRYILENYNIDGFQLDYIRYWDNIEACDFGYDKTALDEFEAKYGVRPTYNKKASWWNDWVAFRTQYVTDMVKSIRELVDEVRPSVLIGADVVPNIQRAYNVVYQDYPTWLDKGYIDILFPMSYGEGFEDQISKQVERCGENIFISVGLGSYMDELTGSDLYRQTKTNTELKTNGSTFFEATSFFAKDLGTELASGIYKNKAITPTYDKYAALAKWLEYTKGRINDVILPFEGMTSDEASSVISAIDTAIKAANDKKSVSEAISGLETAIKALSKENAKQVLLNDFAYSKKIAHAAETIPARVDVKKKDLESSSNTSAASSATSDTSTNPGNNNDTLIIIICGIAVVIAAVAAFAFVSKSKSKNESKK